MNAIILGLSLVSAATAQVANGVSAVPYSAVYGSASPITSSAAATATSASAGYNAAASSGGYSASSQAANTQAAYTQAPSYASTAAASAITPPPASSSSYDIYSMMPYSSFMAGGYQSLDCGYGYQKMSDGSCQAMSWWQTQGCYETIIINHG